MKKQYLFSLCVAFVFGKIQGQDIHFSQYFSSPLTINPALSGEFNGQMRAIANYKNQWNSISSNMYKTMAASADGSLLNEKLGCGLLFFNDKAGASKMGLTQIALAASTKVKINDNSAFRAGLMAGYSQRTIDYSNLKWENQWDGQAFNTATTSGENNTISNYSYLDVSAGVSFHTLINDKIKWNAGIGAFHLNKPKYSFYSSAVPLSPKFVVHTDFLIPLQNSGTSIMPGVVYFNQGATQEIAGGLMIKKSIGQDSRYTGINVSSALLLGVYYRVQDAAIIYAGFDYKNNVSVMMSYDVNISGLTKVSKARGGIEISLIYKLAKTKTKLKTP